MKSLHSRSPKILFCSNPECPNHSHAPPPGWYIRFGSYRTALSEKIPRYRCKTCGRTFSSQTFSIDYFAKRMLSYPKLFRLLVSCTSIRDLSRIFACSTGTIANKTSRLARQMMVLHGCLSSKPIIPDEFVIDGFENFTVSQYFPNSISLLAGKSTQFLYDLSYITLRRKGIMTEAQTRLRSILETQAKPPSSTQLKLSFRSLLDTMLTLSGRTFPLVLHTDEHLTYLRVLTRSPHYRLLCASGVLQHHRTSSKKARTVNNPLFSANYIDRELRKQLKECVRETLCFGRNVNNAMERMVIYRGYHNYVKPFRQKKASLTHGEAAGIGRREIRKEVRRWFSLRAFFSLQEQNLLPNDRLLWFRSLKTPLKRREEYIPCYVYG